MTDRDTFLFLALAAFAVTGQVFSAIEHVTPNQTRISGACSGDDCILTEVRLEK